MNETKNLTPDFAYAEIDPVAEAYSALEYYTECIPPSVHTYIDEVEDYLIGCKLDLRFQYKNFGNAEDEEEAKMYEDFIRSGERTRREYELLLSYLYQAREAIRTLED